MGKSEAVGSFICFLLVIAFSSLKNHIPDLVIISERFVSLCLTSTVMHHINAQV